MQEKRETARLAVLERPLFAGRVGKRGDEGCVVAGEHRGLRGAVFWQGGEAGRERVGLKVLAYDPSNPPDVLPKPDTYWASSRDVVGPAQRWSALAAQCETPEQYERMTQQAEMNMLALDAAGHAPEAELWGVVLGAMRARGGAR